jgi:hypothetical protein
MCNLFSDELSDEYGLGLGRVALLAGSAFKISVKADNKVENCLQA